MLIGRVAYYGTGYYYRILLRQLLLPYQLSYGHGSWYNPNTAASARARCITAVQRLPYNRATTRRPAAQAMWKPPGTVTSGRVPAHLNPRTGISTETPNRRRLQQDEDGAHGRGSRRAGDGRQEDDRLRHQHAHDGAQDERGGSSEVTRQREAAAATRRKARSKPPAAGPRRSRASSGAAKDRRRSRARAARARRQPRAHRSGGVERERESRERTARASRRTPCARRIAASPGRRIGGGSAISTSGGLGDRTTIAQSGSGDVYAGHDGMFTARRTTAGRSTVTAAGPTSTCQTGRRAVSGPATGIIPATSSARPQTTARRAQTARAMAAREASSRAT